MLGPRQVFLAQTAEFCEALSTIPGVKLAFYDDGQVQVTSQAVWVRCGCRLSMDVDTPAKRWMTGSAWLLPLIMAENT
jgi:hypothetical protein